MDHPPPKNGFFCGWMQNVSVIQIGLVPTSSILTVPLGDALISPNDM